MCDQQKVKRNIKPFDGSKYSIWKLRIRALIDEEEAIKVLTDEAPTEPDESWKKAEKTAKGIIIEHLDDSLLSLIENANTAKEILTKMDEIYERKSLATQLTLEKKLLSLQFKEDMPLLKHFIIFDEMLLEVQAAGANMNETSKIARLLLTLPRAYDPVVTAIQTLSNENLSLQFIKTRLLDYEIKLNNERNDISEKVLQIKVQKQNQKQNFVLRKFNNNQYSNHKHTNTNKRYKMQNKNFNNKIHFKKCDFCGRKNHEKKDCFFYKKQQSGENNKTVQHIQNETINEGFAFMCDIEQQQINKKSSPNKIHFIIDSGATDHLINNEDLFSTCVTLPEPLKISVAKKGNSIIATKRGDINVQTNLGVIGKLINVLYSTELPHNLLSVRRLQEAGMRVTFKESGEVTIEKHNEIIANGEIINGLMCISFNASKSCNQIRINQMLDKNSYKNWHDRLGHINKNKFLDIKKYEMHINHKKLANVNPTDEVCESCIYGKFSSLPFSKKKDRSHVVKPLYIIHSDVCGPITPKTFDNKSYFVTFIDEYTHYTVVYLLNNKSEVCRVFQDYVRKSETSLNSRVAYLYCDNGREYLSNELKECCAQKGIQYHLTIPYTPQQNSVAERMNRSLVEKARAMIYRANVTKELWGEAVLTATYLINIVPTKALNAHITPYELWHQRKPRLDHLKIFGSTVYVHDKLKKNKFDKKAIKGIFVGYQTNGYKIIVLETNKVIVARDVIFDETNFNNSKFLVQNDEIGYENENPNIKRQKTDECNEISKNDRKEINKFVIETNEVDKVNNNKSITEIDKIGNSLPSENEIELRRSVRIQRMPIVSYDENLENTISAQSVISDIPSSYYEIKSRNDRLQWESAIKDEIDSLLKNETWEIVPRPKDKNVVDCKWIFKIKNDIQGNKAKYKARLVARGFSQKYLQDYEETFAPVTRITTFRIILVIAIQFNLLIHQMDVKTAFLNGILEEEIYMRVPDGITANSNQVCKLKKALYGLKQSARCWFQRFDQILKSRNFQNSPVDRCLYFLDQGHITKNIYIILYVDDILIVTYEQEKMNNFKKYLMQEFSMVDMQEAKCFLGINIERVNDTITLEQSKYLNQVLTKFNMSDCKTVNTPLAPKLNYEALNSDEYHDAPCRNLIGCLMYAMLCTRPDLCTAVNF